MRGLFAPAVMLALGALAMACAGDHEVVASAALPSAPRRASGITIERVRAPEPPGIDAGDGTITIARFDAALYRPVLLTARDGRPRTLPEWARDEHLVAAINAAMYEPDGRATSLLVQDGVQRSPDDPRFGAILALDPRDPLDPWVEMRGRDCQGTDLGALRARYRSLVASYRLLDCAGRPIPWVDEKRYSAAAIGVDRDGRLVLVHVRSPYLMRDLARFLAEPSLGLRSMMFVEGGPEATLLVDDGGGTPLLEIGSWETGFHEADDVRAPWPLPNVLGIVRLDDARSP